MGRANGATDLTSASAAGAAVSETGKPGLIDSAPAQAGSLKVGLVGHAYLIHDRFLSMDIPAKVKKMGGEITLPENLPPDQIALACRQLPKRLFWTLGQKIMGSVLSLIEQDSIAGIIHLTAFGCGPDSLVGDLAERYARRRGTPFLLLTIDEHTGEAGVNTRLEAFMDMLPRRYSA